jgi:hypothetical protein
MTFTAPLKRIISWLDMTFWKWILHHGFERLNKYTYRLYSVMWAGLWINNGAVRVRKRWWPKIALPYSEELWTLPSEQLISAARLELSVFQTRNRCAMVILVTWYITLMKGLVIRDGGGGGYVMHSEPSEMSTATLTTSTSIRLNKLVER